MNIEQAAEALQRMYNDPATGKAVSIHLFGIRYAEQLSDLSLEEVVKRAGLPTSYKTELRKGINLARYVVEK
jgi:5-methylcytosine-specific restriction protein B